MSASILNRLEHWAAPMKPNHIVGQTKMKTLLVFMLLCSVAVAAKDTPLKPVLVRELSLKQVSLKEGERIASIEVEVAGASFSRVHIPMDWSFEASAPVSGVAVLKGGAAHGVGMTFTAAEFQRFVTLAFYDYAFPQPEFSVKVKLGLYFYDQKKKSESERVIELSPASIVLEEPNLPEPRPGLGSALVHP